MCVSLVCAAFRAHKFHAEPAAKLKKSFCKLQKFRCARGVNFCSCTVVRSMLVSMCTQLIGDRVGKSEDKLTSDSTFSPSGKTVDVVWGLCTCFGTY